MKQSARTAYEKLYTYFGLRSRDGYVNKSTGNAGSSNSTTDSNQNPLGDVYHLLYGDDDKNPNIREICEKISNLKDSVEERRKIFCITPYSTNIPTLGVKSADGLPLNNKKEYKEQGLGKLNNSEELFTVHAMNHTKFSEDEQNRIDVIQVFPVEGVPELADTDVLTLYMSTINSVNMSLAIPYVDVSVTVQGKQESGNIAAQAFSFGNFLKADKSDSVTNANFVGTNTSIDLKKDSITQTVASMEIFTSPQTLVNATPENVRYNENTDVGRHIDIFRPFMAIENLSLNVVPANAGLIAFKTAQMKIRLFDRGRLSEIAPIVAPSRFGLVKFDIQYGWSHPGGRAVAGRPSDSQDDRIGQLIDSMKVTESYQVVNSNFSFEQDGSVSIDLKLSMLGRSPLSSNAVNFTGSDADSVDLGLRLEEIQKILSNAPKGVNVPSILTGGIDTFLSAKPEDLKKIKAFYNALASGKDGSRRGLASKIAQLINVKDAKNSSDLVTKFQDTREKQIKAFIDNLKSSPDPFLRTDGLIQNGVGVSKEEIESGNYASLGAIMTSMIGDTFQSSSDVIFIFNCFNKNAGAMYDHNIAQFPIKLEATGKSKNQVTLKTVLEKEYKKRSKITPEDFFVMLNQYFLSREDSEAYGLSDLYQDTPVFEKGDQVKEQYRFSVKKDEPASQLKFEETKLENLTRIYQKSRTNPNFTIPRISMQIDCKPSSSGKSVTKVIVTDQASSNVGDIQEIFNEITSKGFFEKENIPPPAGKVRSAQHGEIAKRVFQKIESADLIDHYPPGINSAKDLLEKLKELANKELTVGDKPVEFESGFEEKLERMYFVKEFGSNNTKLRNIFYSFFPTLIYGSMGSGIITAQLSSNQNDALTTIMLQKQETDSPVRTGLPIMIHPTQLSMEVFGSPLFKYSQKFFVDFGTGTSADNFYVVTGVDMNFAPGEFKTSLKMTQLDVFGRFMKLKDVILKTLISAHIKENSKKPDAKKKK